MEILYAKKARISKICINMEEETGEKMFLIQRVHCYTRRRAWISRTRWNSFFPIERGTRDDDRRRVKPDSSTGTGSTSTVHRVFSMKLVVPVDDAHRERFQLQMRPGMRSVVSRQLDACTREIDRRRRNSFFIACNFVHVLTNRQSINGGR